MNSLAETDRTQDERIGYPSVADTGSAPDRRGITHGKYALLSGAYPKGCSYVARTIRALNKQLTEAVQAAHAEVSLLHAATIQTACRHEARALLCQRYLRKHADEMSLAERLAYMREIGTASDSRDKALRSLGFDKRKDWLDDFYRGSLAAPVSAGQAEEPQAGQEATECDTTQPGEQEEVDQ